jgi:hypothetical protein
MNFDNIKFDEEQSYHKEVLSRRAALKRIGLTTGIAALALFKVDDLTRLVAKKIQENQICNDLANELASSGIAFADCLQDCKNGYNACTIPYGCPFTCVDDECNPRPSDNPLCLIWLHNVQPCIDDYNQCKESCPD